MPICWHTQGLSTDVNLVSSIQPGSNGAGALLDMTINLDYLEGKTCYEALTYLLDTLHATITRWGGAWLLSRETNVTITSGKVNYYDTTGSAAQLSDSVQALGKMYSNPAWPVGQLSMVINPAKKRVGVQAPWHLATCLQNPDMESDTVWSKIDGASYSTDGYLLPQGSGSPYIMQNVSLAGIRVPMRLTIKATGLTSLASVIPSYMLAIALTYTVGSDTYHLGKDDYGNPAWVAGSSGNLEFTQNLTVWDASRIDAEEVVLDNIPTFLLNQAFPSGTLSVMVGGYGVKVYSVHLDVVLPKGYQDILHLDNGARGEGQDVEIAIGRETADVAYYMAFLQGLLLDSGSLITSFADANFTTGLDYLSFISRDYALSVALPRVSIKGKVYLENTINIPPLVFVKGALNYWLQTWSWDLYEDELEITAITLPAAQLTITSETIRESDDSKL